MVESGHEERIVQLLPNIYQIRAEKPASHVYLIKGVKKKVLIDTGIPAGFPLLRDCLRRLDVRTRDIQLIILTHEHYDHIGATTFFWPYSVVGAHRLAANKIELQDEFVTLMKHGSQAQQPLSADLWLEDGTLVDLGNYRLRVVHTPGHTSGCICVYEMTQGLLFSGDTVFAGGTLSSISSSGNISDYMNSLERLSALRAERMYPSHGKPSDNPQQDIQRGLEYARALMQDTKILFDAIAQRWGGDTFGRVIARTASTKASTGQKKSS